MSIETMVRLRPTDLPQVSEVDLAVTPTASSTSVQFSVEVPAATIDGGELVAHYATVTGTFAGQFWVGGRELVEPVSVTVSPAERGTIVVEERTTGIFGSGPRLSAAIEDFRAALSEHLDVLERSSALSADLSEHLEFLRRHLRR